MRLQLCCWPGLQASEDLTVAGKSSSKMAHSHGHWHEALVPLLAVGRRPQFLDIWASPEGCLSVLTTWQLASARVSDPKENKMLATVSLMT